MLQNWHGNCLTESTLVIQPL